MNSAEIRDAERRRAAREGNSMNQAELREAALWQAARDLRADKMHATRRLCADCRDTFAEEPTAEQLAVSVWSLAAKMPRETMMALVVELLSAHLRHEGVGEASDAG